MPNFLEALGRADAPGKFQQAYQGMTDVMQAPENRKIALEQQGLKTEGMRGQNALTGQNIEEGKISLEANRMKSQKQKEVEEKRNKIVSIESSPGWNELAVVPEEREKLKQHLIGKGAIDEKGMGKAGAIQDAMKEFAEEGKQLQGIMDKVSDIAGNRYESAKIKFDKAEKSGDPKKIEEANKELGEAKAKHEQVRVMSTKYREYLKNKQTMKDEFEAMKQSPDWDKIVEIDPRLATMLEGLSNTGNKAVWDKTLEKVTEELAKKKPQKEIERTVDLGDRVEIHHADGTVETKKKGIVPGHETPTQKEGRVEAKEERKKKADVDKMYAQYNVNRITKQGKVQLSDILAKQFGIAIDPQKEWPKMTREQFDKLITTGELPEKVPEKLPPEIQKEYDMANEAIKKYPKKADTIKKEYKKRTGRDFI